MTRNSVCDPFEDWMNGLNDRETNEGILTPRDYQTDIIVEHLDRNDEVLLAVFTPYAMRSPSRCLKLH